MALEPREVTGDQVNPELVDMTRRFWTRVALTVPVLAFMISEFVPGDPLMRPPSHWHPPGLRRSPKLTHLCSPKLTQAI
jgi:hypothetical protein